MSYGCLLSGSIRWRRSWIDTPGRNIWLAGEFRGQHTYFLRPIRRTTSRSPPSEGRAAGRRERSWKHPRLLRRRFKTWIRGTGPRMTAVPGLPLFPVVPGPTGPACGRPEDKPCAGHPRLFEAAKHLREVHPPLSLLSWRGIAGRRREGERWARVGSAVPRRRRGCPWRSNG